ncbi:hypothetical protein ACPPVU_12875 [Mucilaginibacter sp. McL0603]|uniref:hypothetical protein n=1 Tax=Mucilaginibacter sp. McL0603 TaxID=3415670 RepID=UPI003CEAA623
MERAKRKKVSAKQKTIQKLTQIEREKERKMLNLIAEIIVEASLRELYETGD